MLNKANLLLQLIEKLKTDLENQQKSFESARQASIEAPGRMESRYDTMGIESAWVADGLSKSLDEKKSFIARLEAFRFNDPTDCVSVGSIVVLSSASSPTLEYFFILPVASGYKLREDKETIVTITKQSFVNESMDSLTNGEW